MLYDIFRKSFDTIAQDCVKQPLSEYFFKRHIHHENVDWIDGKERKFKGSKGGSGLDLIYIDVFFVNDNPGPYNPDSTKKR